MKRIIILLTCLATPAIAADFPVSLADGATWTITAEHTQRAEGAGEAHNWSLKTIKQLTWHAGAGGKPATLTVTPVSAVPGENSPAEVAAGRSLAIPATLTVDESLAPGEIQNRAEVRAEFIRLVPKAAGAADKLIEASAAAMIASELGIASRGQGFASLKPGQAVSAPVDLPNPFGGPPLRGIQSVKLSAPSKTSSRAVIEWRQTVDPNALKGIFATIVNSVEPAKRDEARAAFATASLTNDTVCFYEIDIPTGLARRGECYVDVVVSMQGKTQKSSDRWVISQTMPGTA
ncbi:MAG: hypothetical protein JWQ29_1455 [Phenylobacterium sp.]|nr:hypothetical protein [Phenylobacterium sp.]